MPVFYQAVLWKAEYVPSLQASALHLGQCPVAIAVARKFREWFRRNLLRRWVRRVYYDREARPIWRLWRSFEDVVESDRFVMAGIESPGPKFPQRRHSGFRKLTTKIG